MLTRILRFAAPSSVLLPLVGEPSSVEPAEFRVPRFSSRSSSLGGSFPRSSKLESNFKILLRGILLEFRGNIVAINCSYSALYSFPSSLHWTVYVGLPSFLIIRLGCNKEGRSDAAR